MADKHRAVDSTESSHSSKGQEESAHYDIELDFLSPRFNPEKALRRRNQEGVSSQPTPFQDVARTISRTMAQPSSQFASNQHRQRKSDVEMEEENSDLRTSYDPVEKTPVAVKEALTIRVQRPLYPIHGGVDIETRRDNKTVGSGSDLLSQILSSSISKSPTSTLGARIGESPIPSSWKPLSSKTGRPEGGNSLSSRGVQPREIRPPYSSTVSFGGEKHLQLSPDVRIVEKSSIWSSSVQAGERPPSSPSLKIGDRLLQLTLDKKPDVLEKPTVTRTFKLPVQRTQRISQIPVNTGLEESMDVSAESSKIQQSTLHGPGLDTSAGSEEASPQAPHKRNKRNIYTRMEEMSGPLQLLTRCVQERLLVRVLCRAAVCVQSMCRGYILAFDKHFNMAMTDVDVIYRRPSILGKVKSKRSEKLQLAQSTIQKEKEECRSKWALEKLQKSGQDSGPKPKVSVVNKLRKLHSIYEGQEVPFSPFEREALMLGIPDENVMNRHISKMLLRGENVVSVSIVDHW